MGSGVGFAPLVSNGVSSLGMDEDLGVFRLIRRLGDTDLSDVYAAIQRGDGGFVREVLIKRFKQELSTDVGALAAFQNEGRLLARLRHRGIPHIYDLRRDYDADAWYSALEYIPGPTLRLMLEAERQRDTKIPLGICLTVLTQLCAAVHHMHELRDVTGIGLGVVHRNLAPEHVVLGRDGIVRIMDFGAACTSEQLLTVGPDGRGTAGYMAPEQVLASDPPDRRADVFALGILGYEMTAGVRLFPGTGERLRRSLMDNDARHPSEHRPGYPDALAEILLAALARNVHARPSTAQVLRRQLEGFAAAGGHQLSSRRLAEYVAEAFPPTDSEGFDASGPFAVPSHSSAPPAAHSSPSIQLPPPSAPPSVPHVAEGSSMPPQADVMSTPVEPLDTMESQVPDLSGNTPSPGRGDPGQPRRISSRPPPGTSEWGASPAPPLFESSPDSAPFILHQDETTSPGGPPPHLEDQTGGQPGAASSRAAATIVEPPVVPAQSPSQSAAADAAHGGSPMPVPKPKSTYKPAPPAGRAAPAGHPQAPPSTAKAAAPSGLWRDAPRADVAPDAGARVTVPSRPKAAPVSPEASYSPPRSEPKARPAPAIRSGVPTGASKPVSASYRPPPPAQSSAAPSSASFGEDPPPTRPSVRTPVVPPDREDVLASSPGLSSHPPLVLEDVDALDDEPSDGPSTAAAPSSGTPTNRPRLELNEMTPEPDDDDTFVGASPMPKSEAPDKPATPKPRRSKRPEGVYIHVGSGRTDVLKK